MTDNFDNIKYKTSMLIPVFAIDPLNSIKCGHSIKELVKICKVSIKHVIKEIIF